MMTPVKIQRYGWHPGLPDHRHFKYALRNEITKSVPTKVDLRPNCPPVYNQGDLGSCTANASAGLVEYILGKEEIKSFMPSRLFIYYNERVLGNTVKVDSGASLTDAVKVLSKYGAPKESIWPYNVEKFKNKPSQAAYKNGIQHLALSYEQLDNTNIDELKSALAADHPFLMGFTVYESFESEAVAKSGILPMPSKKEKDIGGHAVLAVGYDDSEKSFIIRNSWGPNWGQEGYFLMPYDYVTNPDMAGDFWVIQKIKKY